MEMLEPRRLFAVAPGQLDPSFDGDGVRDVSLGGMSGIRTIVPQPDGKIVVLGYRSGPNPTPRPFSVYRYNSDGSPDTSFGGGDGFVDYNVPNRFADADDVKVLSGGKLLVLVHTFNGSYPYDGDFLVARLNADGSLDTSFGSGSGMVTTKVGPGQADDQPTDLFVMPDGRFYSVGSSDSDFAALRYLANGTLDTSYGGGDGVVIINNGSSFPGTVIDADGKLVMLGGNKILRLTTSGAPDTSFSGDGLQNLVDGYFNLDPLVVDGDRLLLTTIAHNESGRDGIKFTRLRHDGGISTGFGTNGSQTFFFPGGENVFALQKVIQQPDGKILACGLLHGGLGKQESFLVRFTADGLPDPTFGTNGAFVIDAGPFSEDFNTVAALSDGRLLAGGYVATTEVGASYPILARFLGDASVVPDPTIAIESGVLTARGTAGNDAFFVRRTGADQVTIEVRHSGNQSLTRSFDMDDFTGIRLEGFGGDDTFNMVDALVSPVVRNTTMVGGLGSDTVSYETRTAALAFGSFEKDGATSDVFLRVTSGAAVDRIDVSVENFVGGSGNDTFNVNDPAGVVDDAHTVSLDGRGGDDTFMIATAMRYTIDGGAGNDVFDLNEMTLKVFVRAGDGDDLLRLRNTANPGLNDGQFNGGAGSDTIDATNSKAPQISLYFYPEVENITGAGHSLRGQQIYGNALDNRITLSPDAIGVFVRGQDGDDTIIGGANHDSLYGEEGNDSIRGGGGEDFIDGGDGTDTLVGGGQLLNGEVLNPGGIPGLSLDAGVLTFVGIDAAEQISIWLDGSQLVVWVGGVTQSFNASAVTRIVLNGNGGDDLLKLNPGVAIPALLDGGAGADKLIGGAANDTLLGGTGADHLSGNGGNDLLDGGLGFDSDSLHGGSGKDTADYSARTANLVIGLDKWQDDGEAGEFDFAGPDIERVLGGNGNDRIGGSASNNELYGGNGNDTISGGGGNDALFGAAGNDKMDGGDGDDYLEGGAGHDTLYGGAGGDTLLGLAGNDRLLSDGDDAKDTVSGGTGIDFAEVDLTDVLQGIETFRVATP